MVNLLKIVLAGLVCNANAFYESASSKVINLSAKDFQQKVIKSDEIWYVEFYAPWCGHCKNLAPHWDTAARKLNGVVKVGAINVDAEENKSIGGQYGVQGFPTIKVFGLDKKKSAVDYDGPREAAGIIKHALQTVTKQVEGRSGSSKKSSGSSGSKGSSSGSGSGSSGKDEVVVLTANNFEKKVYGSKDIWLVEFYAPWCGHCKALEPEYKTAASKLKGQAKLGKMDCDDEANKAVCGRMIVTSFPTLIYWNYGNGKNDANAKDYNAPRQNEITDFMSDLANKADIEPDIHEIFTQKIYEKNCKGPVVCVICFLPNIKDSNAADRNTYLTTLKVNAKKLREKPFVWFWLSAGDQLDLEGELQLRFGFPFVIAISSISPQMKMIATMRTRYNKSDFNEYTFPFSQDEPLIMLQFRTWVKGLLIGEGDLTKLAKPLAFKTVDKWDGKDAPALEEKDYEQDEL